MIRETGASSIDAGPRYDDAGGTLRILLVEDDELIRFSTAETLSKLGFAVLEARSGEDALELLETMPVDVLLTDVGLPGISGIELARKVLQRPGAPRIVFATGMKADALDADLTACAELLPKPYGERELSRLFCAENPTEGNGRPQELSS